MPWYDSWFDSDAYPLVYAHRDEEEARQCIDLIESNVEPVPGARILDVGCGRGRHALRLAERGYRVTGIDLSEPSIRQARQEAAARDLTAVFSVRDMRDTVCNACFDGVVNLFTTFGYFANDADNEAALRAMATALDTDDWFVQDFLNAPQVRNTLVPEDTRTRNGVHIRQTRRIEEGRIHKTITLTSDTGTDTYRESVRLYTRTDLELMYRSVGLEPLRAFGHYDGRPHTSSSPRLILIARRTA